MTFLGGGGANNQEPHIFSHICPLFGSKTSHINGIFPHISLVNLGGIINGQYVGKYGYDVSNLSMDVRKYGMDVRKSYTRCGIIPI